MAQVAECLLNKQEVFSSKPSIAKNKTELKKKKKKKLEVWLKW
jgi:hypothetical protein